MTTQYKLTHENFVFRIHNGIISTISTVDTPDIPNTNPDYLEYKHWLIAGGVPLAADAVPAQVPYSITPAQGKTVLLQAGYWEAFIVWITSLEGDEKVLADIATSSTQSWNRDSPFLLSAAQSLAISSEELDRLFIEAEKIVL